MAKDLLEFGDERIAVQSRESGGTGDGLLQTGDGKRELHGISNYDTSRDFVAANTAEKIGPTPEGEAGRSSEGMPPPRLGDSSQ